jgi:hypothetical protein
MGHTAVQALLEANGADKEMGKVVVPEHVNKIRARARAAACAQARARAC